MTFCLWGNSAPHYLCRACLRTTVIFLQILFSYKVYNGLRTDFIVHIVVSGGTKRNERKYMQWTDNNSLNILFGWRFRCRVVYIFARTLYFCPQGWMDRGSMTGSVLFLLLNTPLFFVFFLFRGIDVCFLLQLLCSGSHTRVFGP